ncbi:MAG: nucleoside triphosphate pyrophosphohydrolase [Oculatellaceae cyanobacterium bins.114]|nr:nucleoside triphosphate pyrophosphohydrolase [Oculatellaceae cyanobacterium bins.114]
MSNADQNAQIDALQRLIDVVAQLRSPEGGCPWDLAQTPQTLIPYVIEEAYEVVDAIRQGNSTAIADELGDLLLQVVLQSQIASEAQDFNLADVATGITEKLIRRHPHVFGDVQVQTADEVHQNWEKIKAAEEQANPDQATPSEASLVPRLSRYARSLPPIMAGMKISKKAAAAGFEWEDVDGVWAKFQEELEEFRQALAHETKEQQQAELGDVLFTLINIARWYDLDPAEALQSTNQRFVDRLARVEAVADRPLSTYSLDELEQLWQYAKAQLRQGIG